MGDFMKDHFMVINVTIPEPAPMKLRFEIKDRNNKAARGMRFTALARARKELARSDAPAGRFFIFDRKTKEEIA